MGIMGVMDSGACASAVSDTEGRIVNTMTDIISRILLWATWNKTYEDMVRQAVAEWVRKNGDRHEG